MSTNLDLTAAAAHIIGLQLSLSLEPSRQNGSLRSPQLCSCINLSLTDLPSIKTFFASRLIIDCTLNRGLKTIVHRRTGTPEVTWDDTRIFLLS
jgi:hypothetical protein